MAEELVFPTWNEVRIPQVIVEHLKNLPSQGFIDYLVLNKVFKYNIKYNYTYSCHDCGFIKRVSRIWEDYSSCEGCGSKRVTAISQWRMGKDYIEPYSSEDSLSNKIIDQMITLFCQYFKISLPDEFLSCGWRWDKTKKILSQKQEAYGISKNQSEGGVLQELPCCYNEQPYFYAKFICGEEITSSSQALALAKAAVLCPFLWDETFNWKTLTKQSKGLETHILPILYLWIKHFGLSSSRFRYSEKSTARLSPPYAKISPAPAPSKTKPYYGSSRLEDVAEEAISTSNSQWIIDSQGSSGKVKVTAKQNKKNLFINENEEAEPQNPASIQSEAAMDFSELKNTLLQESLLKEYSVKLSEKLKDNKKYTHYFRNES